MEQLLADDGLMRIVLAATAGALLVLAIVFLVLWRTAARAARSDRVARAEVERERFSLELTLAEQGSRLQMIRELHEVAVHSIGAIVSQAEGARYAATQDPAAAGRAAAAIAEAARATRADLRRVLTVVRDGEAEAFSPDELGDIPQLLDVMRAAGLVVEFSESGEPHELGEGAGLAVFRILQEALGNSLDHGGAGTTAQVQFTWTDDGLQVLVEDDGTRAAAIRNGLDPYAEATKQGYTVEDDLAALTQIPVGRGMTEMRERTELFGGVFEAHRVPGVGFTVQAVFPSIRHHNGIHGVPMGRL